MWKILKAWLAERRKNSMRNAYADGFHCGYRVGYQQAKDETPPGHLIQLLGNTRALRRRPTTTVPVEVISDENMEIMTQQIQDQFRQDLENEVDNTFVDPRFVTDVSSVISDDES